MRAEKSESDIAEHRKMSIQGNFEDSVEKKEEKTASKSWFLVSPASNQNQNQPETMNMVCWFQQTMVLTFAGFLV
jgi:hypothetical protein